MTDVEKVDLMLRSDRERYFTSVDILECVTGRKFNKETQVIGQTPKDIKKIIRKELRKKGKDFESKRLDNGLLGFRYPKDEEDPIAEIKTYHKRMRLKQVERLIKASVGLFPSAWLVDLIDNAQKMAQEQSPAIIGFNQNDKLTQIHLVPTFYNAIESKQTVQFTYCAGYAAEGIDLVFHPHYIREYNQRWFVFGKAFTLDGIAAKYANCALDRIEGEVLPREDIAYVESTTQWSSYFNDIIGVTKKKGTPELIEMETMSENAFHRIATKPLHHSQRIVQEHHEERGMHGIVTLKVIPNEELISLLLSYRSGIRITKPQNLVDQIRAELDKLNEIY